MLNLGWVDFSKSDRNMVLSVLRQLSEPGALDELGIGTIRDGFSDILFPGTSTIQTRAKYLFIIPYICMELERGRLLKPHEFISKLEQSEISLIDVLAKDGVDGIIGQRSRQTLRRKPSSIYWSALRTFGFFSEPITLSEYATYQYAYRIDSEYPSEGRKRRLQTEENTTDDSDIGMREASLWRVPLSGENWRDGLTIELSKEEAVFLKERILSMPKTTESLLALVLRESQLSFVGYEAFEEIDEMQNIMPTGLRNDYLLARDFSRFIYGAQAMYNVIYSNGQNEYAYDEWKKYLCDRPEANLLEIQKRLNPNPNVMRFLKKFQDSVGNEKELKKLIISREKDLKGSTRAKLTNTELYQYHDDDINMVPLSYRFYNVQRIIRDIFNGVEKDA